MPSLDSLADLPDRPALKQLSRALWSRGTLRGAAVLVGAGVSRAGAQLLSTDATPPPLWSNLADDMARELYGAQSANAPKEPLRLAEEFRAGLGDAALADFLRRSIRDDTFEPGSIHRDLLDLPWADVLTTNYDTLLERAALDAPRGYDIVEKESDLPHALGPRIIKLHGSMRDGAGVVISEEDYRTYPQRRAAFVNTARQLFIENELCLLGFSGDDPNFLQWAGWVRDRLSSSARRIYLVGALDLPPVKRRLLEARGVAPIDLAPAVKGERADRRHSAAISIFLAYLKSAHPNEPGDWRPEAYRAYPRVRDADPEAWLRERQDPEKVVETFRGALSIWRMDRETCPGWVVCPREMRRQFREGTGSVDNLLLALNTLPECEKRDALLELAWRYDRGAQPLPPWLGERMDALLPAEVLTETDAELVRALALTLLGAARSADDEVVFTARAARFEMLTVPGDLPALVAHERCLFARDRLDFAFVSENLSKVDGDDPVWGLRRAALLYWVGKTEEARGTIGAAVRKLRARVLRDPDSVALRSRFVWARWLAGALRWEDKGVLLAELNGLDRLALRDYDPWEQLRVLDDEVAEGLRKRWEARQIEPGFEAGSYRDNSNAVSFRSAEHVTPLCELRHVAERVGMPIRMHYVNVLGTHLADALKLAFEPTPTWHSAFLSTEPSYSKGPIDVHFGRIAVARLDAETVIALRKRIERAVTYWCARVRKSARSSDDVSVLRLYVEALSRMAARDDAASAKEHVRLAVELGSDDGLKHWWLDEQVGYLLKRAFDAVPAGERGDLSPELLRFPLAAERYANGEAMSWYDPSHDAYRFVCRSGNEGIFDARVAAFLHHLAADGPSRREAAARLFYLHEKEQLTSAQVSSFASALWKELPKGGKALPAGTNLLPHAFLIAPAPPDIDARARVYAHLFGSGEVADPEEMVMAAAGQKPCMQPSEADAATLFDKVAGWRPKPTGSDPIRDALSRPAQKEDDRMMASILGIVAAPALAQQDRTVGRAEVALTFLDETDLPEALAALPVFYGLKPDIDRRIEGAFRRPLAIGDRRATPVAVNALDLWLHLSTTGQVPPPPDVLRDRALRALEGGRTGGLSRLIYLARRLIEADRCGSSELDRIVEVLDELREETDYGPPIGDADIDSDRAVSLPLIRAECVCLARALEAKGVATEPVMAWCNLAAHDPLPEVREAARYVKDT